MNFLDALNGSTMPGGVDDAASAVRPGGLVSPRPGLPPPGLPPISDPGMSAPTDASGAVDQGSPSDMEVPPPVNPGMAGPSMAGPSAPGGPGAVPSDPRDAQYKSITQSDGSVVLHLLGPGGVLGPAVKIIPPPRLINPEEA